MQGRERLFLTADGASAPAEVEPGTLCQYIGYTDLRKNRVFERDIVFCEDNGHQGSVF